MGLGRWFRRKASGPAGMSGPPNDGVVPRRGREIPVACPLGFFYVKLCGNNKKKKETWQNAGSLLCSPTLSCCWWVRSSVLTFGFFVYFRGVPAAVVSGERPFGL